MRHALLVSLCRTLVLLSAVSTCFGQADSRISGTVQDPSGTVMPAVKVTATNVNRGTVQITTTNESGRYSFPTLPIGEYAVSGEAAGFKKSVAERVRLEVNQPAEINLRMEIGDVAERRGDHRSRSSAPDERFAGWRSRRESSDCRLAARSPRFYAIAAAFRRSRRVAR